MKIITLALLVSLFISDTITAQTGKTVKIGNQVWMSENLGTTAGSNTKPTTASSQRQAEATPSTTANSQRQADAKTQKPVSTNCSYKFTKPDITIEYFDNRIICCYCNNFATYSAIPNLQLKEEETYQAEKLFIHWQEIEADSEHQKMDIERYSEFIQNSYAPETNSFEKMAGRLAESGQSKTQEQIISEGTAIITNSLFSSSEMLGRTGYFNTSLATLHIKDLNGQSITAKKHRVVDKYEVKSKWCDKHQGYCK